METNNSTVTLVNIENKIVVQVQWITYVSGRKGFRLLDPETLEPLMTPTVSIDGVKVNENEVLIKNYSENHGIYEALLNAGFIKRANKKVRLGLNQVHACELNLNYKYK